MALTPFLVLTVYMSVSFVTLGLERPVRVRVRVRVFLTLGLERPVRIELVGERATRLERGNGRWCLNC